MGHRILSNKLMLNYQIQTMKSKHGWILLLHLPVFVYLIIVFIY